MDYKWANYFLFILSAYFTTNEQPKKCKGQKNKNVGFGFN